MLRFIESHAELNLELRACIALAKFWPSKELNVLPVILSHNIKPRHASEYLTVNPHIFTSLLKSVLSFYLAQFSAFTVDTVSNTNSCATFNKF